MTSMNNWLAFSLSSQELPSQTHAPGHGAMISTESVSPQAMTFHSNEVNEEDISGECFDHLPSDTSIPNLRPDAPFGILEAFNRTHHPQGLETSYL